MVLQQYYSGPANETFKFAPEIIADYRAYREYMDGNKQKAKIARQTAEVQEPPKPSKPKTERGSQRRAKSTPQMDWLRELICPFVYGDGTPDGPRPSVTKADFIGRWNQRMGLPSLPNYKLLDHFQASGTAYYMGQGWANADRTLVLIDIDVLKSKNRGTPEGAKRFAEHLKSIWPNLYFERSTNGKGIHAYIILWKHDVDAKKTNAALKRFELWLRAEAKRVNADIELVEIKGTCLDLTLDDKFAQAVTFGTLAKLPREVNRFSEWEQTTTLRVQDLESNIYDVIETKVQDIAQDNEAKITAKLPNVVCDSQPNMTEDIAGNDIAGKDLAGTDIAHADISEGSTTGKFITKEQLSRIPHYECLYREWVGPDDLMAGKFRVTAHDFAVALMLLQHFKADANHDESMPVRRVGELWTALYVAEDITRGFNHHRWKVIRDFLSASGHINWIDNRYEHPNMVKNENGKWCRTKGGNGKVSVGIACKWRINDFFDHWLNQISSLSTLNIGEASFVDTKLLRLVPPNGNGRNLRPVHASIRALKLREQFDKACELMIAA